MKWFSVNYRPKEIYENNSVGQSVSQRIQMSHSKPRMDVTANLKNSRFYFNNIVEAKCKIKCAYC